MSEACKPSDSVCRFSAAVAREWLSDYNRSMRLSVPTSGSARRRARERRQAQLTRIEGERLAQERRDRAAREKKEQQRQARAELASYEPWGRAGGGAPNPRSLRRSDLRAGGIFPEDELRGVSLFEACRRWSGRRRRRRTPRLREDPQLCYADSLRQTVDNDIRYRQTPDQQNTYRQILDDMVDTRKRAMKHEMKKNLEYERKMQTMNSPWGKPGPGGTIWRNPRDIGLNFSKSMGWSDNDLLNKIQSDEHKRMRSSLTLPNVKRDDDAKDRNTPDKENIKPQSELKLPDIKNHNSPKTKTQEESTQTGNGTRQIVRENDCASTINLKNKPMKKKIVKRLSNGEKIKRTLPDDEKGAEIRKEQCETNVADKKLTPEEAILRMTGGVELVPILARRRRVGARTLPSSDVTRPPEDMCQWRELLNEDYLRELKHQMKVKFLRTQETRQNSAESVRQHHETWAALWGRPGHGAPQQRGRYARNNLARLLYVTPLTNAQ